jgi:hypothetical protein
MSFEYGASLKKPAERALKQSLAAGNGWIANQLNTGLALL